MAIGLALVLLSCGSIGQSAPLAAERAETRTAARLSLTSPAFSSGEAIPLRHSAYGEGVSPPLAWDEVPEGTRSFVLLVEIRTPFQSVPSSTGSSGTFPVRRGSSRKGSPPMPASPSRDTTAGESWLVRAAPARALAPPLPFPAVRDGRSDRPRDGRATRQDLLGAMRGHVLAAGTLIGTFRQPQRD